MRRREVITLLGGAAAAWPLGALGTTQRIAIVTPVRINDSFDRRREPHGPVAFFNDTERLLACEGVF